MAGSGGGPAEAGPVQGRPALAPGEVHVWRIPLRRDAVRISESVRLLSEDERRRMARFRFDVHRERFALRRGALRILLGRYLGEDPAAIVFRYSSRGKPDVERPPSAGRLRFNLSDSEELAILGVTTAAEIGVDVERLRELPDVDDLARRYFSIAERKEYASLAPERRTAGFFNCWTRKEAWLKARGEGLAVDLRSFDVSLTPGSAARLLATRDPAEDSGRWSLHAWEPEPGFVAAAAVEAAAPRLVLLDFRRGGLVSPR